MGVVRCPPSVSVQELREACDYLLVPFNAATIKCQNLSKWLRLLLSFPTCLPGSKVNFLPTPRICNYV